MGKTAHKVMDAAAVFDAIAKHTTDAIMLLDRDARILFINQPAPGLTIEQVIGTKVYEYVPEAQHEEMRACFKRVLESGEPDTYDNVYATPAGDRMYYQSRVAAMSEDGQVTGFVVLSSDVTVQRTSTAERDRLFELSLDIIAVATLDGRFRRINPACRRTLGYDEDELLSRPFFDFIHEDDKPATRDALSELSQGADVMAFENRYRHRDGHWVTLQWHSTVERESQLIYAIGRDVTQRRALETQLLQSQKLDALGQLAGGIAHDFNNLMLAILANVDMSQGKSSAEMDEPLRDIGRAASRATDLTRQLLTFSRRQEVTPRSVDLNAVTRHTTGMLRRLIPASINVKLSHGLRMPLAHVDPTQLEQVILNLCLNARDAIQGAGEISLETSEVTLEDGFCSDHPWASPGRYVLLSVRDTGAGMSGEVQARAFEPFFTTKAPDAGTGLGLSTVYGIVQQHGGLIHLDSQRGRGTTIGVYLPVAQDGGEHAAAGDSVPASGGQETILIAEDEELVRKVVVTTLEAGGYQVVAAQDGLEAVQLMAEHGRAISLLLFDIVMPQLSGPEAYRRIAEMHPDVPVLFTSGYSDSSHFGGGLPEGTEILGKPYSGRELLQRVRAVIAAAPARDERSGS